MIRRIAASLLITFTALAAAAVLFSQAGFASADSARPRIYGIAFVRFKAVDLAKSRDFYSKVLGLKPGADGCKGLAEPCFAVNPRQYVQIIETSATDKGSFLDEVGYSVSDVSAMHAYLSAHGRKPTAISRGANGLRYVETEDPEQNRMAFVESTGNGAKADATGQISDRIFHAGWVVRDLATEKKFYSDLLGFRLYWYGGFKDADIDWYEIEVPDGENWVEFMLNISPTADHKELGVQNHFSLGVRDANAAAAKLRQNGLPTFDGPEIGRDGKNSLDAYDPDGNRVEVMEFTPAHTPCCHPYTAPHPKP